MGMQCFAIRKINLQDCKLPLSILYTFFNKKSQNLSYKVSTQLL